MAKNWIQKTINPEHKGYCTPMTKSTCTPRRKALAKRFKSGDLSHAGGGKLIIPSGVVPIFSTEYEDGGVMYFLGGSTGNENNEAMVGGAAQLGLGIATGDPGSIVSGAAGFLTGNIKNMGTVLKDKDSSLLEKGLSLVNPIAGGIFAAQAKKRENEWNESANMFKERNSMLGIKANGGSLTEFNNGGSHQQNIYGGIPQGVAPDGQVNKVEQGETKWQDYIFSDRLMIDESTANNHNLPKTVIGKTFADASKKLSKISKERPNDPISKGTLDSYMNHLMMANDDTKTIEENNTMAMGGHIYMDGDYLNLEDPRILNRFNNPMSSMDPLNPITLKEDRYNTSFLEKDKLNASVASIAVNGENPKTRLGFRLPEKVGSALKDPKNLRYAPIAFDALAATGLFGKTPTPTEYSPTLISQPGYLTPEQIDEQTMRSAIDTSYNTGISALTEASGGSGAALRSGITGLSSGYARSLGEAFSNANRANIEQKQAAKQFNLQQQGNVAAQNVNAINQAELYNNQIMNAVNAKNYEDRMSYLAKGAEGLGDIGYEQRLMEIMPRIYGYSDLGEHAPTVKKCGGRLRLKNHKK